MVKRFLITTALEETWLADKPVLFLGEWCRRYSRKEHWSELDAEVLPYHWDDRGKFYSDYQYLQGLYESLLRMLRVQLNQVHGVDHSIRYWRILIGPWVAYFIQVLFDRWSSIQHAVASCDISETIVLTGHEEAFVPNDMVQFDQMLSNDEWNHHLYSFILKQFTKVSCIEQAGKSCPINFAKKLNPSFKYKLAKIFSKIANYFVRDHDIFLINTYMPVLNEVKLYLRFGQLPQWWRRVSPVSVQVDWRQREWTITDKKQTDFEKCVFALIPKQIPRVFLEGYNKLIAQSKNLPWPKRPKVIFTSSELWFGSVTMAYVAEKVEFGAPLVYGQHGGLYNVGKFSWAEEHETAIADKFLTWGGGNRSSSKIAMVGMLTKMKPFSKSKSRPNGNILLVLQSLNRYSARLDSEPRSSQLLSQMNDAFLFVDSLPPVCRNQLLVRTYMHEYGWESALRWQDYGEVRIDTGKARMEDLLKDAQLAVFTYNSTGYLESFALNIPTIIFWDPEDCPLRDSAISIFKTLKQVGIFHETPESAANHVATIWDHVEEWWNDPEVQEVLQRFKKRYCFLPKNLLDRVEFVLRDVIANTDKIEKKSYKSEEEWK